MLVNWKGYFFRLIKCDFASAAVLISMGALLGKLSPEQYIVLGFFELAFYAVNEYIIFDLLLVITDLSYTTLTAILYIYDVSGQ